MIRLAPQNRFRVSDRVAVITALVLLILTFSGISNNDTVGRAAGQPDMVEVAKADDGGSVDRSASRKLSISLLLFGRG